MSNLVYTSTNTSSQAIDTIDLPMEKVVSYKIHVAGGNTTWYTTLDVNHNGVVPSEEQSALVPAGVTPLELVVSITGNTGYVNVTPTFIPTSFTIERSSIQSNLYSENTLSGRIIRHTEGVGAYLLGNANNMTIRLANNNFFGNSAQYITAGVLGPIASGDQLYTSGALVSFNSSSLDSYGNYTTITSSGQHRNCQYIELNVVPNQRYRVTANAFFIPSTVVYNGSVVQGQAPAISVGTTIAAEDIVIQEITTTETLYNLDFTATTDTVYISYGFGVVGTELRYQSPSIKQLTPFATYNQSNGTFYFKWTTVPAGTNVAVMDSNRVYVDGSNNVFINTVNCGAQQATSRLAYSYTTDTSLYSYNGAAVVQETALYNNNVQELDLQTTPVEFSYVPVRVSNTTLIELTND